MTPSGIRRRGTLSPPVRAPLAAAAIAQGESAPPASGVDKCAYGSCYDTCGFVSTSSRIKPGMKLPSGGRVNLGLHHVAERWGRSR
ncbi:hypothetical protein [Actinomyces radicidentis]|nr:hypothetical protein [Actinomyces radicidentis]